MDDKHCELIRNNLDKLVSLTDYKKVMDACISAELLYPVMRENIEKLPADSRIDQQNRWHRELFLKVTHRGPEAYNKLKVVLSNLNYEAAVRLLNAPSNTDTPFVERVRPRPVPPEKEKVTITRMRNNDFDDMPRLEPYTGVINPTVVHEVVPTTEIQTDSKLPVYPMDAQENRGVLFIANIIDFRTEELRRDGAEEDAQSLLHLFKNLGFVLFFYQNLSQMQFLHLLDELIASEYAQAAQCFVMALMTHGNSDERVQFSDDSYLEVKVIIERFKNSNCRNLQDKPKILLFPFCRGDVVDKGVILYSKKPEINVQTDGVGTTKTFSPHATVPSFSDLIICYASVRGHQTLRDPSKGSWYVQSFCRNMAKHCHDTQFEHILKMIQAELSKLRTSNNEQQMGTYENIGFNSALYFNPGVCR